VAREELGRSAADLSFLNRDPATSRPNHFRSVVIPPQLLVRRSSGG
jgi:hypothetical protein